MERPDPDSVVETAYGFFVDLNPCFSDMDCQRHLNNVAISSYYEDARARCTLAIFGPRVFSNPDVLRIVVAKATVNYLGEGVYPDPLRVGVRVSRIGRSSFQLAMALFQRGRCIGVSEADMVHVGADGPLPLPELARKNLQALLK